MVQLVLAVTVQYETEIVEDELLHPFDLHGACEADPRGGIHIILGHSHTTRLSLSCASDEPTAG